MRRKRKLPRCRRYGALSQRTQTHASCNPLLSDAAGVIAAFCREHLAPGAPHMAIHASPSLHTAHTADSNRHVFRRDPVLRDAARAAVASACC